MGFFHEYPYTDFHEINLDWILRQIMKLHKDYDEFKALNEITFSGAWDITKQYPAWTIVNVGGTTGYISVKPVPAGVDYQNTDYWRLVVDYTVQLAQLQNRVIALENQLQGAKIYTFEDEFDTLSADGLSASKIIQTADFIASGITPHNSAIIGSSAYNRLSDTWWSNDAFPGKYKHIKEGTVSLSVSNLAAGASADFSHPDMASVDILGIMPVWDNTGGVLTVSMTYKANTPYVVVTNTYSGALTDTGTLRFFYVDPAETIPGIDYMPCIVPKLRIDGNGDPYLVVQSTLTAQYTVGDKFRVSILKYGNIIS